jgi:hypothetical protein
LKEAIADAKAVRETAISNAKIALEEAFTPKLQSILSQKLQSEMEDEEDADMTEEYGADDVDGDDSSGIGAGEGDEGSGTDNAQPKDGKTQYATKAHTELDPETEEETAEVGEEEEDYDVVSEGEEEDEVGEEEDMEEGYHEEEDSEMEETYHEEEDEDELDLAEIIAELEAELDEDEEEMEEDVDDPMVGHEGDNPLAYNEDEDMEDEEEVHSEMDEMEDEEEVHSEMDEMDEMEDDEEEIDLDEILREMGYGEEEDEDMEEGYHEEDDEDHSEMEEELEEAYSTIKELQSTINEVNLLNAKLLYTNKLFRSYNLNNEQKMKVVETLDRTGNVREVKLVYSTLAESFKYNTGGSVKRKPKTNITESFASKATASTAPKKEIISESNDLAERFKKLANIK